MGVFVLPPFVMVYTIIVMLVLDRFTPLIRFWHFHWGGAFLIIAGLIIAQWHARLFKRRETNINTFGEPDLLITEGLFHISRNPMYLGFVITLTGVATMLGSVTPFLAPLIFGLLANNWYIPFEERAMKRKFGEQYVHYQSQVRRWL